MCACVIIAKCHSGNKYCSTKHLEDGDCNLISACSLYDLVSFLRCVSSRILLHPVCTKYNKKNTALVLHPEHAFGFYSAIVN